MIEEDGWYDFTTADSDLSDTKVYEMKIGIDADMAAEMTQLANNKIKLSTATDMLAKHTKLSTMVDLTVMNLT